MSRPFAVSASGRAEVEGRAFAKFAVDAEVAAHGGDEFPRNGEAKASAAIFARGRLIGLLEGAENRVQLVGGDADAGVAHGEQDPGGISGIGPNEHLNVAFFREFQGVIDQIANDLPQPHGIGGDRRPEAGGENRGQIEPLALRLFVEKAQRGFGGLGRIDGQALHFELAGLDLGEIENVIDDRQQALAGAGDDLRLPLGARGEIAGGEQLCHDQHAIHRRADFMAHGGEKIGFCAVGRLGAVARLTVIFGAFGDLPFEAFGVTRQFPVARADFADHGVEARHQLANFIPSGGRKFSRIIMRPPHATHGLRQSGQRAGDGGLQPAGNQQGQNQRETAAPQRLRQRREDAIVEIASFADDLDTADRAAF